jgi:hypothetical protein
MRRLALPILVAAVAVTCAAAFASTEVQSAPLTTLRLDGIGPLHLGMSREAAVATGWLANRRTGCPLGGPPLPLTYRITGPEAPKDVEGSAEFIRNRLRTLSLTAGVRTAVGVKLGQTTAPQMIARYRAAGLTASSRYDSTFVGTFVTVKRKGAQVIGGFAESGRITILGIPFVPLCE